MSRAGSGQRSLPSRRSTIIFAPVEWKWVIREHWQKLNPATTQQTWPRIRTPSHSPVRTLLRLNYLGISVRALVSHEE